jgi:hypothetical protein
MNTRTSTFLSVLSLVGLLTAGGCDQGKTDAKSETKDGKVTVETKDGKVTVEGKAGVDGATIQGPGGTVVVNPDGSVTAKSADGNEAVMKVGADGTAQIDAKSADGTQAVMTAKDGDATIKTNEGGLVQSKSDGSSTVKQGEDEVTKDAEGNTVIKSGDKEVKVGKDGKIEIPGVPGL